jgi:hypothetical protein
MMAIQPIFGVRTMKPVGCSVVLLATVLWTAACDGRGPTTPTSPPAPPPPPSTGGGPSRSPSPPQSSIVFEMTGVVTDDEGIPVPGATVTVWHDAFVESSVVVTDASGRYSVRFSSARGSNAGPPGTELSVGMALIDAPGYDWYARYIVTPTEQVVENFRLHRIHRITAGESAVVTVAPHDRVCGSDYSPGRETICGVVHVVAPSDGTLTVEAVPAEGASAIARLEVFGSRGGGTGNPTSIPVTAGTEYMAVLAVPWGLTASQSFVVKTSMSVK